MAKKKERAEENILAVEEALSKTEVFIEKNQKILYIIIAVIAVIVLAIFGFKRLYIAPRDKEAKAQMFMAEKYFEKDSLRLALNGDGNYLGFLDIINDYKLTKTANLAHYYAGLSYLHLGEYEDALEHLQKFRGKDKVLSTMAIGAMGDVYMELGETEKATGYYRKAANHEPNAFTTPLFLMKAGMSYELQGNYTKALEMYERIRDEYNSSFEYRSIDKYIARVKGFMEYKEQ